MIEELGELNAKFYKLFGEFFENAQNMPSEPKGIILKHLLEQYKAEYERLRLSKEIEELNELHEIEVKHSELVPRKRFFFFSNRSMKQLENEVGSTIDRYFKIRENVLAELKAMFDELEVQESAEHRTTAFDEPCSEENETDVLTAQMSVEELEREDGGGIISINCKKKPRQSHK